MRRSVAAVVIGTVVIAGACRNDSKSTATPSASHRSHSQAAPVTKTVVDEAAFNDAWQRVLDNKVPMGLTSEAPCSSFLGADLDAQLRALSDHVRLSALPTGGKLFDRAVFNQLLSACRSNPSRAFGDVVEEVYSGSSSTTTGVAAAGKLHVHIAVTSPIALDVDITDECENRSLNDECTKEGMPTAAVITGYTVDDPQRLGAASVCTGTVTHLGRISFQVNGGATPTASPSADGQMYLDNEEPLSLSKRGMSFSLNFQNTKTDGAYQDSSSQKQLDKFSFSTSADNTRGEVSWLGVDRRPDVPSTAPPLQGKLSWSCS